MTTPGAAMTTAVKPSDHAGGLRTVSRHVPRLSAVRRRLLTEPGLPRTLDVAATVVVLFLGLFQVADPASPGDPFFTRAAPTWLVVVTVLGQSLPLLARRRAPIAVFAILLAASITQISASFAMRSQLGLLVALYSVSRYRDGRQVAWASVGAFAIPVVAVFRLQWLVQQRYLALFFLGCAMVAAIALGLAAKSRRAQLQAFADRAARLEVEREQRTQLATAVERARVSREMHDIVGHNLAVITGLADGAASLSSRHPANTAATTRAFELIADTSRQALSELRRTLGVMRGPDTDRADEPGLSPQPGLAEIPRLIERVQSAGPRVTYTTDGDLTDLAPGLQLTVYRVVQEALTNILKHAEDATHVTVAVSRQADTAVVTVRDDAPRRAARHRPGEGHGLLGLRERAGLAGGTMTAGPGPERGWSVSAVLPLDRTEKTTP
jgi:signal transduction histidine kinase